MIEPLSPPRLAGSLPASFCRLSTYRMWPDWTTLERSWQQFYICKRIPNIRQLLCYLKFHLYVKTAVATIGQRLNTNWATFSTLPSPSQQ